MQTNYNDKAKRRGVVSKSALYAYASKYSKDAIETLAQLMYNASQDSVRMAAAKALLDKSLPDQKAVEVTNEPIQEMSIRFITENPTTQKTSNLDSDSKYIFGQKQIN